MAQKVVIPKGLINPNETTVVEIPQDLQNVGTVVARRTHRGFEGTPRTPRTPKVMKKRSYTRHSYPSKRRAFEGRAALDISGKGLSFYGRPFDPDATPEPSVKYQLPKDPADRYMSELSSGEISYDSPRYRHINYDRKWHLPDVNVAPRFIRGVNAESTLRDIDDSYEHTLYRDFRPQARSSPPSSPARTPGSLRHWHSDMGTVSPVSQSEPESYFHSEVTTETPDEIQTEVTEEKSYYDYDSSGAADLSGLQEGNVDSSGEYCPPCSDSSGSYRRYDSSSSGGYQNLQMSGFSPLPPSPSGKMTQRDLLDSLGNLETTEMSQIMTDLSQFQSARRKLVFDASSLPSASDFSVFLLGSATI